MNNFIKLGMPFLVFSASFNSCIKNDLYDADYNNDDNFIVPGVNSSFDWNMFSTLNLNVKVADQYEGKYYYRIDVYDKNPLQSEDASLFAMGVCKKDMDFNIAIVIPSSLSKLFVLQTAPNGNKVVFEKNIESNGSLECVFDFNNEITTTKSLTKKSVSTLVEDYKYYDLPSNAIVISSNNDIRLESGKNYVIPAGHEYSGRLIFDGVNNSKVYVQGSWIWKRNLNISSNDIVVMNGGKISMSSKITADFNGYSVLAIAKGGTVTDNGTSSSIKIQNYGCAFYNNGTLDSKGDLYIADGSSMLNNGVISLSTFETRNGGTKVSNNGHIESDNAIVIAAAIENYGSMEFERFAQEQGSFENAKSLICSYLEWQRTNVMTECYIYSDEILTVQGSMNVASTAAVKCNNWQMTGAKIRLDEKAQLDIRNNLRIYSEASELSALGNSYSLIKAKNINFEGYKVGRLNGNLMIATDKYNQGDQWNPVYEINGNVVWAGFDKAPIEIPETDCTTGNNSGNGEEPGNPDFPIVEVTEKLYTFVLEDNFPSFGDYDMNDIVVSLDKQTKYINKDNNVESVILDFELKAVGAVKRLGFGFQLDEVSKSNIKDVAIDGGAIYGTDLSISSNLENNQNKPVIILFDDAHKLLRDDNKSEITNTYLSVSKKETKTISVTVDFNTPVSADAINLNTINLFGLIFDSAERKEIHVPGYATTSLFTSKMPNKGSYMWALKVPFDFKYPCETISIHEAYPDFNTWVESDKTEATDWYNNPVSDKIFK